MAVTISLYNHTLKKLTNKEVTLTTLKLMLLNGASFNAANTTIANVDADEVSGNGWAAGGETLANVTVTTITTNDAKLDADNISVTATGGDIGPTDAAALYDDTSNDLLAYIDFGAVKTAGDGLPFDVNWSSSGILTFTI